MSRRRFDIIMTLLRCVSAGIMTSRNVAPYRALNDPIDFYADCSIITGFPAMSCPV